MKARSLRLNSDNAGEYKFDEDLTLVTFDEKTPLELLEAFNNVLKHLSKDHDVDVRDEDPHVSSLAINDQLSTTRSVSNQNLGIHSRHHA